MHVRIAHIAESTAAEGPGRRFALWFQGCPLRCAGCCNPEMLSVTGGTEASVTDLMRMIEDSGRRFGIEGITLLGGEPTAQAAAAARIAEGARRMGLSVMVFSGFRLGELQARKDAEIDLLLAGTDILVDGAYRRDQPDSTRRWIGSTNQQIHFLTDRYRPGDGCWQESDTLEIRMEQGEIAVNGFPARSALTLWKRPRTKQIGKT